MLRRPLILALVMVSVSEGWIWQLGIGKAGGSVSRNWQFTAKFYSRQDVTATTFAFLPGAGRWLLSQPGGSKFAVKNRSKSGLYAG